MGAYLDSVRRVVVKVGSSTLTHSTGKLNLRRIEQLVTALADLRNSGREVVLVTSGAVAAGMDALGLSSRPHGTEEKQAVSAVGQCLLTHIYDKMFGEYGLSVAQLLLTRSVFEEEVTRRNAGNTFARLFDYGVVPIVNENDSISTYELESMNGFGDNDRLSAYVALLTNADLLILLSDIDGLFDSDPHSNPDARLIPVVNGIDDSLRALAGGAGSAVGTGGMASKLLAAEMLLKEGRDMVIANGSDPSVITRICSGEKEGTLFSVKGGKADA
ncbi:MAG: glutamate 5-kinase [Clostridia bacterium]|nr:glutamate 5-kinase [Clostridia bacterium]